MNVKYELPRRCHNHYPGNTQRSFFGRVLHVPKQNVSFTGVDMSQHTLENKQDIGSPS